jgi:hypothetical protein
MWVEIFKSGLHTDSSGNTKLWDESDLDSIAAKYDPQQHEAPVVIGHPKDNSPAYGWVEALQRQGQSLWAKLRLIPEFVEMVKKGLYKKRSISLYDSHGLRHVGFLGAMPPAVKGLKDVQFNETGEGVVLIEDSVNETRFSEEDVKILTEKARLEGEENARNSMNNKFMEDNRRRDEIDRKRDIRQFVQRKVDGGVIPPFMVQRGLCEFMDSLDESTEIKFSEGTAMKRALSSPKFLDLKFFSFFIFHFFVL